MGIPILQVDAFTAEAFRGNPAAVCLMSGAGDPGWMQDVAREMNLAETAFLQPDTDGYGLRWFTPTVEMDLCGHATLAAAHALWETGRLVPDAVARFHTRSGLLTAARRGGWIELDFPATPAQEAPAPAGLGEALGAAPRFVGRSRFDYLAELDSEAAVRELRPDFRRLAALGTRGVIVTARSEHPDVDFVSRFFAPGAGIDEDPVTGSAHCALGPYWGARLGKTDLVARQESQRGGTLRVGVRGERVELRGQAVRVSQVTLFV
jgi:predicted PhzF superfamily epimerase YddE/YHI9